MNTYLQNKRPVDKILTSIVMGYELDQEYSGHHLFPDVAVPDMSGKIISFGTQAFMIVNTKRAPGETVRGIGISYSADKYFLENRVFEAITPEEDVQETRKANIPILAIGVTTVYEAMRLEGEYDMASLALDPMNYVATNKATLSTGSFWNDPTADLTLQIGDAKSSIRAKTGHEPNVFHLDREGFEGIKKNEKLLTQLKHSGKAFVDEAFIANYFGIEKVVVAKTQYVEELDSTTFLDLWKGSSVLAYVPPKPLRNKSKRSFGYNYIQKGFPKVEKEYWRNSTRSYHQPVLMRDKAIITDSGAGFLFQGTTG